MAKHILLKRAYDARSTDDGVRILVDRLWPRGISKEKAKIDMWLKDIAPSNDLRKWFGHEVEKWEEFRKRYIAELKESTDAVAKLQDIAKKDTVTLVFGAKDIEHNNATVLREFLLSH